MKCSKCNSENVQIQAKEVKPKLTLPLCLTIGGLGLMFLGPVGAILGAVLGLIVGAIVSAVLPTGHESITVCQSCGYVSKPIAQTVSGIENNPLFCSPEESNLDIIRNDVTKGTIVVIRVKVDDYAPFDMKDISSVNLKVSEGEHIVSYEQINGIGRKKNKGQMKIVVDGKKTIGISFTRKGLIVK